MSRPSNSWYEQLCSTMNVSTRRRTMSWKVRALSFSKVAA
jgi:hypothetical protein